MKFSISYDEIKVTADPLTDAEIEKFAQREILTTIGSNKAKADKGLAPDNVNYPAYSKPYEKWKVKEYGATRSVPDLLVSGDMRRSYHLVEINRGAEGQFTEGAMANRARWNEAKGRTLAGFGKDDEERIHKSFAKVVDAAINKLIDIKKKG